MQALAKHEFISLYDLVDFALRYHIVFVFLTYKEWAAIMKPSVPAIHRQTLQKMAKRQGRYIKVDFRNTDFTRLVARPKAT